MIELVLHKSFSWDFQRYMLKFDIALWGSLLNTNHFACFPLHHLNRSIWNEMISKQTLTFGTHFAITSRIYKVCNFQCRLWVTIKCSKSNNRIIKEFSCDCVPIASKLEPLVVGISRKHSKMKINRIR
jgi:hypothetical protein